MWVGLGVGEGAGSGCRGGVCVDGVVCVCVCVCEWRGAGRGGGLRIRGPSVGGVIECQWNFLWGEFKLWVVNWSGLGVRLKWTCGEWGGGITLTLGLVMHRSLCSGGIQWAQGQVTQRTRSTDLCRDTLHPR